MQSLHGHASVKTMKPLALPIHHHNFCSELVEKPERHFRRTMIIVSGKLRRRHTKEQVDARARPNSKFYDNHPSHPSSLDDSRVETTNTYPVPSPERRILCGIGSPPSATESRRVDPVLQSVRTSGERIGLEARQHLSTNFPRARQVNSTIPASVR
nr:hypothetical protein CFP56_04592 [Quercus suber]